MAVVEQAVNVGTQQQAVAGAIRTLGGMRPDVGGFESRKAPLPGGCAVPVVRGGDERPKCPLPEPGFCEIRLAESRFFDGRGRCLVTSRSSSS